MLDLPGSSVGKESAWNAVYLDLIPGLKRSPWGGLGNPRQYSCLEKPLGQSRLAGYSPWCHKESNLLHRTPFLFYVSFFFFWPWPGIKPVPPALEGKVLATVLPGKSHNLDLKTSQWSCDELTLEFNRKLGRPIYCIHPDEESGDLYRGGCIGGVGSNWILHVFILFWSQQDFLMESINWVKQSSSSWKWSSV